MDEYSRKFEQNEITKTILMALKSFASRGRIHIPEYGNVLQTYKPEDIKKCAELVERIETGHMDLRMASRLE